MDLLADAMISNNPRCSKQTKTVAPGIFWVNKTKSLENKNAKRSLWIEVSHNVA